jgi:polar amino acid transport system substrate-binding protein
MKLFKTILFCLVFSQAHAAVITLKSDLWCPYACDPKSDRPGFMVEIAKEVFKKHGHTVHYSVMNWARAVVDVKSGKYDGLVGCSKADVDGFVIPTVATGIMSSHFFTLQNNSWVYVNQDSLKSKKIGVINDYTYGDQVDDLVKSHNPAFHSVSGEEPLLRLIQMTESKRLDGFVENPLVLDYTLKKHHKYKNKFRVASDDLARDPELFIAFTPNKPESRVYAKILDEGVRGLRKSGRLKIILSKYNLSDWVK